MAKPIAPTPTLNYEDSKRFLEGLGSNDNEFYRDSVEGVEMTLKYIELLNNKF